VPFAARAGIDRVVVAMEDRRESMPVRELLDLRLCGVVIENSSSLMERLSGKLPLDGLNPSVLIFTEGFRMSTRNSSSGACSLSRFPLSH